MSDLRVGTGSATASLFDIGRFTEPGSLSFLGLQNGNNATCLIHSREGLSNIGKRYKIYNTH